MCIGNNSYEKERLSFEDTILLGLEIREADGTIKHVCGYYNRPTVSTTSPGERNVAWEVTEAADEDDFGWDVLPADKPVGNAMLIAIPAKPGTVGKASLVAMADYPSVMTDYKRAVSWRAPVSLSIDFSRGFEPDVEVVKGFDQGTYDVLIASNADAISQALALVDEDKRPTGNPELYRTLGVLYPGFTFLLFCFSESDKSRAGCAVVKYEPMESWGHVLYLPGLDGHNGKVETGQVELNHTLVVGSYQMSDYADSVEVDFTDKALVGQSAQHPVFLRRVIGTEISKGTMAPQGDFLFSLKEVREGKLRAKRQLPPGWKKVFGNEGVPEKPYFIHGR